MTKYKQHLEKLFSTFEKGLAKANAASVLIYSGEQKYPFKDDNGQRFNINPYFKYWLPMTDQTQSFIYFTPGEKPHLFLFQVNDYWHAQPKVPEGEWQEHFDLSIISQAADLTASLGAKLKTAAFIGEELSVAERLGVSIINPTPLIAYVDYCRAYKSDYEVENMRVANEMAATAHLAAKSAFYQGASELEIHHAYLAAINIRESQLPYNNIVALNQNGAILHYDHYQTRAPKDHKSFLIDAGASYLGYHADISRTYVGEAFQRHEFNDMYQAYQQSYAELLTEIKLGTSYLAFHDSSHQRIAKLLSDFGLVNCSAQEAYQKGYSRVFFPCGVGHYIGLQVHDIGGYLINEGSTELERDERYPFLRLNRPMEDGIVFTVEPGIYFIDMLLAKHQNNSDFNWKTINELKQFGGFRMEDSIALHHGKIENLSQQAFDKLI